MTTASILARAAAQLEASPDLRADAARDALTLLLHALGITRAQFYADPNREITAQQQAAYDAAIARRLKNEPLQYITGEQEFYGLALRVTPAVLIPRPETEHLVEAVLAELAGPADKNPGNKNDAVILSGATRDVIASHRVEGPRYTSTSHDKPNLSNSAVLRILDVGAGSGAIAIALAHHLPGARVTATDISPAALAIAKENAARHSLAERIQFLESDLLAALPNQTFDAIVSNPPYVPESDRAALHPQVRDYEPAAALFAGQDGLDLYRRLIPQARAALAPGGLLALEIGYGQRDAIAALLADWLCVRFVDDLQGIPRVVLARKQA